MNCNGIEDLWNTIEMQWCLMTRSWYIKRPFSLPFPSLPYLPVACKSTVCRGISATYLSIHMFLKNSNDVAVYVIYMVCNSKYLEYLS